MSALQCSDKRFQTTKSPIVDAYPNCNRATSQNWGCFYYKWGYKCLSDLLIKENSTILFPGRCDITVSLLKITFRKSKIIILRPLHSPRLLPWCKNILNINTSIQPSFSEKRMGSSFGY